MPKVARRTPMPGEKLGSPCPFTTEFADGICGEPADHWSSAIRAYVCGEHYAVVTQQFAGVAAGLAGTCPECGEERAECVCRDRSDREGDV